MKAYRTPIFALLCVLCLLPLGGVAHAAPRPTILVWSRDLPATLRVQHTLAWSLLEYDYQLRFLDAFPQPLTDRCEPRRLSPAELSGVDMLVISDWDGTFLCGTEDVNANLSPDESTTIERFVANGGKLLAVAVPVARIEQDNLPELLALFGISYAHSPVASTIEAPQIIRGMLHGRPFRLSLSGVVYSIGSGTSLMEYQNRSVATVAGYGKGKIAFIGAHQFISDQPERILDSHQLNYPPAILVDENARFFTHLISMLADRPATSPTEEEQRLWKVRSKALKLALSGGMLIDDQPAGRGQADPASIRTLRSGLARGVRCDVTSTCVPFAFEPEDAAQLERAQKAEDRAWDAWERMDAVLSQPSPDYQGAVLAQDEAVMSMNDAFTLVAPIKARSVTQPQPANEMWLWGLGLLPIAAVVAYLSITAQSKPQ